MLQLLVQGILARLSDRNRTSVSVLPIRASRIIQALSRAHNINEITGAHHGWCERLHGRMCPRQGREVWQTSFRLANLLSVPGAHSSVQSFAPTTVSTSYFVDIIGAR